MPWGLPKPAATVVTVQGSVAPGVTIEMLPPIFAVQRRLPSNAIGCGRFPRFDAIVVTAPTDWDGSIRNRNPGPVFPVTKIRPMAGNATNGLRNPIHVSRSFPSDARTRETELESLLA